MISPIKSRLRRCGNIYLLHDSVTDVRSLAKIINEILDKQKEIIDVVNLLTQEGGAGE